MEIPYSDKPSKTAGGTSHLLPAERAKASFNVSNLRKLLEGDAIEEHDRWKKLFENNPIFDFTYDIHDERAVAFKKSIERTIQAYKTVKSNPDLMSTHMGAHLNPGSKGFGIGPVSQSSSSAVGNHYGIFVGAILARASDEQQQEWFQKAINLKILGAYAQTELGHGSNVRALETVAVYDPTTEEFVIDSPTLTSLKWWPGCFGLIATHSVVYARLIIKGKDYGIHEFMVQLRDENHKCMPGVEVGDIGPKMGYNLVDNGYCRFNHVRIPRTNMLARYQHVTKEGEYAKTARIKKDSSGSSDKLKYIVMIATRVSMIEGSYRALAKASTIAIRYSAVRFQGFKNTRENSMESGENSVLDYQVQQYRLFKALSMAYAYYFAANVAKERLISFARGLKEGDVAALPELHATAAGLKAFCTNFAGDMIEECRRCCGGHGATLSSGIAKLVGDYNTITPIAEGDKIILVLQNARYLVRAAQSAREQKTLAGQVKYLGDRVQVPDFTDPRNLKQLEIAFRWRARKSVELATKDFETRQSSGEPFDIAWNNSAVALAKAAEDHCNYIILEGWLSSLGKMEDPSVRNVLARLATHFALVQIKEHGSDWIECITPAQLRNIDREVTKLLAEIRPDAVSLVDAFAFSDNSLQSAIGRYDGNVYEALYDYAKNSPLNKEEYVDSLFKDHLSKVLDLEYIKQGKSKQRTGPIVNSKL